MQYRTINSSPEARKEDNGDLHIFGNFISFTGEYDMGFGVERISSELKINGNDIRALINHDTTLVIGRTKANTLTIERRDDGIYGDILINPNDSDAMNCHARVARGDVDQCSFGFDVVKERSERLDDGRPMWTIEEINLYEISCCTFPAYEDTAIEVRSKQLRKMKEREVGVWKKQALARLGKEN